MKKIFGFIPETYFMRKLAFVFFDIIAFSASLILAFEIRFEFNPLMNFNYNLLLFIVVFLLVKISVFYTLRLYDISWRFVSLQDLANIGKAILLSNGILFIIIYGFNLQLFAGFPRSILLVDLIFSFMLSSGFKISKRMYLEVMRQSIGISDLKELLLLELEVAGNKF